ncbi:MAG: sigma 54-interacting transcriptional regulator [Terriglobales bacterium]
MGNKVPTNGNRLGCRRGPGRGWTGASAASPGAVKVCKCLHPLQFVAALRLWGEVGRQLACIVSLGKETVSNHAPITPYGAAPAREQELPPEELIFGAGTTMARVRLMVNRVAATTIPALIHGESGTGKELIARLLHANSPRCAGPFVQVNCPSLPASLVESELFGYERGAFTGAATSKPGRVEMADGGTLFLDEIGDFALELQAKLLQLLQDGHFVRIGAQTDQQVQARVVCATNRDLAREVERGLFRSDLYYRINAVTIELPPLRLRAEDIPQLTE